MNIEKKHLAGPPKKIGHLDGAPVFHVATLGGLHIVSVNRHGKSEVLGVGSHPGIAKHLSAKKEKSLVFTELNKSDNLAVLDFPDLLEKYEQLTDQMRLAQGV